MKLKTFVRRAPMFYLDRDCVYIRGAIGRGKTETMESIPAVLDAQFGGTHGFVVISGPLLNPPDAVGYLMPREQEGRMESVFTEPFWFRTKDGRHLSEFQGGIILIDEADKMDPDVKKVVGEAALSGRLGPHVIPDGWVVWMAGNRQQDRSGSTKEYDHLINRRVEIDIEDDLESWEEWAHTNHIHPAIITFAVNNPQILFEEMPKRQGPWCTPRALVKAARHIERVMGAGERMGADVNVVSVGEEAEENAQIPTQPEIVEETAGRIGFKAASQLFATLKLANEMPLFSEILAKPDTAKVPARPDAQMLVCYSLAARAKEDTLGPIITYMQRLDAEFTITFGRAAIKRDPSLVTTQAFGQWATKNASLMMALADRKD